MSKVGLKYNMLTIIELAGRSKSGKLLWLCACDCGNSTIVQSDNLNSGHTKSCGCLMGKQSFIHGYKDTKTYNSWRRIKQHCLNPNSHGYKNYGGRGIKICNDWLIFENFLRDTGERPEGMTIDRINNDGDYEKSNCKWSTPLEQANNRAR